MDHTPHPPRLPERPSFLSLGASREGERGIAVLQIIGGTITLGLAVVGGVWLTNARSEHDWLTRLVLLPVHTSICLLLLVAFLGIAVGGRIFWSCFSCCLINVVVYFGLFWLGASNKAAAGLAVVASVGLVYFLISRRKHRQIVAASNTPKHLAPRNTSITQ
jgi:hypothetical protein